MNAFIETLNRWGADFCSFAWPMYWQSSLLILLLIALEWTLRNRLRASVRYALWLVVLVKLCVPPTLALPTSPAWWIHSTPPPAVKPAPIDYTVTYDNNSTPLPSPGLLPVLPAPKVALSGLGWLFITALISSAALLGWLLFRWWQVAQQVRRAETSKRLTALADAARKTLGMRSTVSVRVTVNSMSPAVCGLFRPAILIPRSLEENFSDEQLQAVLLHELIHLRRRDVWVNFLQSLLQIGYWWHPLVWIANARIRRVREEAVDDAVMLALRDDAEAYAPTLLEVAKLALNRPLASLGLVGILESRRALRQRIERLMDFRAPRRAGLTLVSFLGVLAFTAVAVPMGQGPDQPEATTTPAPAPAQPDKQKLLVEGAIYTVSVSDLNRVFNQFDSLNYNVGKSFAGVIASNHMDELDQAIQRAGLKPVLRPRILTSDGVPAQMDIGDGTNNFEWECRPVIKQSSGGCQIDIFYQIRTTTSANGAGVTTTHKLDGTATVENHGYMIVFGNDATESQSNRLVAVIGVQIFTNDLPAQHSQGRGGVKMKASDSAPDAKLKYVASSRQDILKRLNNTHISVEYDHVPLSSVLQDLTTRMAPQGSNVVGVKFIEQSGLEQENISVAMSLNDVSVHDILDALLVISKRGLKYSVQDDGVIFSYTDPTLLYTRTFKLDPALFIPDIQKNLGISGSATNGSNLSSNVTALARNYFTSLGVRFDKQPEKIIFFNDQSGMLFVKASEQDLDLIGKAVREFLPHRQIHIKARFIELPSSAADYYPGSFTNNSTAGIIGILTRKQTADLLKTLRSQSMKTLAEPEVVTTTGRQTQMRTTEIVTIVTNMSLHVTGTNLAVSPDTRQLETGPMLDVVPQLLDDGFTIDLRTIATVTDFLGYDEVPTNTPPRYIKQYDVTLATMLPTYYIRQGVAHARVWDGQTIVLGKIAKHFYDGGKEVPAEPDFFVKTKKSRHQPDEVDREILVLVTTDLVDAAGNRLHSDADLPFALNAVPPQDN